MSNAEFLIKRVNSPADYSVKLSFMGEWRVWSVVTWLGRLRRVCGRGAGPGLLSTEWLLVLNCPRFTQPLGCTAA